MDRQRLITCRLVAGRLVVYVLLMMFAASVAADVVRFETFATGFDRITGIHQVPAAGYQVYVVEQGGRIRIVDNGGEILAQPFLDINVLVQSSNFEQGLTGLAFAPDFPADPRFFVHYTRLDGASVVARYMLLDGYVLRADPASATVLFHVEQPHPTHNCNQLAFGPDGMLYVGCGDGGSGSGPLLDPQALDRLHGKLLRIDVNTDTPEANYAIPPDNPYVGVPGARPEIWANGLRNPYRFSFDSLTGELWLTDVGQSSWEEINRIPAGLPDVNYGWPIIEGSHCWPSNSSCDPKGYWLPQFEYGHSNGRCAIIGGQRVSGASESTLEGSYLYADFCTGEVFALREAAPGQLHNSPLGRLIGRMPTTFGVTGSGDVLLGTYGFGNASVLRIQVNDPLFTDGFEQPTAR